VNLIIPEIVSLHAEEAGSLFEMRAAVLDAPQVRLKDIQRTFDDRIAAHLDALAVAGEHGWAFCQAALEGPSVGAVFTAAVRALEERRPDRLDKLFALSGAIPETRTGLMSALGWVERDRLQEIGIALLRGQESLKRASGIAACSMHRVDPGLVSGEWLADADASVRARALRLVGEVGCAENAPACAAALNDSDPECRFWAAWSSVVIGNRGAALDALTDAGFTPGPHRREAFRLSLQALNQNEAHRILTPLAQDPSHKRWLIDGSGLSGDPAYLPWLLEQIREATIARLAGEAFSLITGVDFVAARLDSKTSPGAETGTNLDLDDPNFAGFDVTDARLDDKPPEGVVATPNDNPDDPNVDMDPDEGLPWPDAKKIEKWWNENEHRFVKGQRYFMGKPVTREHCIDVLKNGYQRQRILAAHYLCLLDPGTPLFNTSAPSWRQQRLLATM
jgi:uncharacterized protein (TIGR02270 family)